MSNNEYWYLDEQGEVQSTTTPPHHIPYAFVSHHTHDQLSRILVNIHVCKDLEEIYTVDIVLDTALYPDAEKMYTITLIHIERALRAVFFNKPYRRTFPREAEMMRRRIINQTSNAIYGTSERERRRKN